jgi:para-aminobenzoate synthetase component 1
MIRLAFLLRYQKQLPKHNFTTMTKASLTSKQPDSKREPKPNAGLTELSIRSAVFDYSKAAVSDLFATISHLPWAFLLHSAGSNHKNNRFDILVADPLIKLTHHLGENTVCFTDKSTDTKKNKITKCKTDPFVLLKKLQAQYLPPLARHEYLPFLGGALGYFSYDLGRQIERLPEIAIEDILLPEMAVGLYDWALIADHKDKKIYLIEPDGANRDIWLKAHQKAAQDKNQTDTPFSLSSAWQSNMSQTSYKDKFSAVQAYLSAGDCYQINLAQRFSASYQGDEWQAYTELARENSAPFSAFLRLDEGAVLCVSPERFLHLQNGNIETKPIKGTRPRKKELEVDLAQIEDLKHAPKDQAENLMIVDLLRNDIGRVAVPGSVKVPTLFNVESFPAVHHLVSTVLGQLPNNSQAIDLLQACFPGGSITGAPKVRAMEIIEELEPHRRSLYCGSIGYISRCQTMDTNIAIRTLVCHQGLIHAWAGGGIVADSKCEAEYQETLDKLCKIIPILSQK